MFSEFAGDAPLWITLIACAFALALGGATERQGGAIYLVGWVGSVITLNDPRPDAQFDGYLAADFVVFAALALLAWKSSRAWPIWACAFQAIELIVDITRDLGIKTNWMGLMSALNLSSYGSIAAMAVGTWIAWREREALKGLVTPTQFATSSPARALSMRATVRARPKMATNDPNRGPWV